VNNPYAVGEHVYLRPLEAEDAADIVRWFNDQDVSRTLRMWKPMTKGAEARFLEELASGRRDYCSPPVCMSISGSMPMSLSTASHICCGGVCSTWRLEGSAVIHAPSCSSFSTCPGAQPA